MSIKILIMFMKKLLLFVLVLSILGCESEEEMQKKIYEEKKSMAEEEARYINRLYQVIVIDTCEYIMANPGTSSLVLTHKGNCKNHE